MRQSGNKALIAAGTGLGQAILYDDGHHFHPLASEGGHADFAPRNELEIELLRYLIEPLRPCQLRARAFRPRSVQHLSLLQREPRSGRTQMADRAFCRRGRSQRGGLQGGARRRGGDLRQELWISSSRFTAPRRAIWRCAPSRCAAFTSAAASRRKFSPSSKTAPSCAALSVKDVTADLLAAIPVQVVLNDQAALRGAAYYAALFSPVTDREIIICRDVAELSRKAAEQFVAWRGRRSPRAAVSPSPSPAARRRKRFTRCWRQLNSAGQLDLAANSFILRRRALRGAGSCGEQLSHGRGIVAGQDRYSK